MTLLLKELKTESWSWKDESEWEKNEWILGSDLAGTKAYAHTRGD